MKLSFILVFLGFLLLTYGSVFLHGLNLLPPRPMLRWGYVIVYVLLFLTLFIGLFLEHKLGVGLTRVITFAGYSFIVVVMGMLVSFLLTDLVRLANHFFHFAPSGMLAFRQQAAWWSLALLAILMVVGHWRFEHPQVVTMDLTVDRPLQGKSLRIVAASDIHLGSSIGKKKLHRYVEFINSRKPDLILLPGDVVDRSFGPVLEQKLEEELSRLKAPMGIYAVSGNHEFYSGVPGVIADYLRKAGIVVLQDSATLVDGRFYVVGRNDRTDQRRKPLEAIVAGLDHDLPRILIDHQPHHLEEAEANDIDLQVSGHTHNGQFYPGNLIVRSMFENPYGYLKKGRTHVYVSSGLGIWGPQYRIGSQSEIVEIVLHY